MAGPTYPNAAEPVPATAEDAAAQFACRTMSAPLMSANTCIARWLKAKASGQGDRDLTWGKCFGCAAGKARHKLLGEPEKIRRKLTGRPKRTDGEETGPPDDQVRELTAKMRARADAQSQQTTRRKRSQPKRPLPVRGQPKPARPRRPTPTPASPPTAPAAAGEHTETAAQLGNKLASSGPKCRREGCERHARRRRMDRQSRSSDPRLDGFCAMCICNGWHHARKHHAERATVEHVLAFLGQGVRPRVTVADSAADAERLLEHVRRHGSVRTRDLPKVLGLTPHETKRLVVRLKYANEIVSDGVNSGSRIRISPYAAGSVEAPVAPTHAPNPAGPRSRHRSVSDEADEAWRKAVLQRLLTAGSISPIEVATLIDQPIDVARKLVRRMRVAHQVVSTGKGRSSRLLPGPAAPAAATLPPALPLPAADLPVAPA